MPERPIELAPIIGASSLSNEERATLLLLCVVALMAALVVMIMAARKLYRGTPLADNNAAPMVRHEATVTTYHVPVRRPASPIVATHPAPAKNVGPCDEWDTPTVLDTKRRPELRP